jgi:peptidoglycan hydrolase CwlO-like protein
MMQSVFDFLSQNMEVIKGIIPFLVTIIALPITVMWFRGGKIRKMQQEYTKLVVDMSEQIAVLYKEITLIQAELAKTKGQLSIKESEIEVLEAKLISLELKIKELMEKLAKK